MNMEAPGTQEPRSERHTLVLTKSESNDLKLVAALHNTEAAVVLREWTMKDIRAEAEQIRARVVETAAVEPDRAA